MAGNLSELTVTERAARDAGWDGLINELPGTQI